MIATMHRDYPVTVGNGKAVHWGNDCGTVCGAAHRNGWFTKPRANSGEVTCKRCIKLVAIRLELDHAAALAQVEMDEAHLEALNEDAQRTEDAQRAADLAPASVAYPAAVALDIWLTEGVVLVGPATDTLFVFECWEGGTAVLRSVEENELVHIAQADIVNWRYLPDAGTEPVAASEIKPGNVVRFHQDGSFRKVASVEHHEGTDLYSFTLEGSHMQFVRHAPELVIRKLSVADLADLGRGA